MISNVVTVFQPDLLDMKHNDQLCLIYLWKQIVLIPF